MPAPCAEVWDEFDVVSQDGEGKPPHKWLRAKYGEQWHHFCKEKQKGANARRNYNKK